MRMRLTIFLLMITTIVSAALPATVEEPASFRMEKYSAPVPATLKGARVLSTPEAEELWRAGKSLFVDVLPRPPKPDLPKGTVWREQPHSDIPGSVWLADVGYGELTAEMEAWFRDSLAELTGSDTARPLVIYCRRDCWMSWNATKRAVGWGYANVAWYPGGVEDWEAAGLPLEERKPRRPGAE
jgi:PQQ-dependent catabolism-associated CXXCW motif protein